jgi:NitT/TauT family transport system substrate-binding protein
MRVLFGRRMILALCALVVTGIIAQAARADGPLRVAKAVAYPFAYTPVDVGIAIGAFKKHGLEIELSSFSGAPKMQQGLASDSVDIGIGGGTDLAFIAKGAPVLAIAADNVGPVPLVLLVTPGNPMKSVDDLKGKTIGTSTPGSIIEWMPKALSRAKGWGPGGIKTVSAGDIAAMLQAIKTNQLDGFVTDVTTGYRMEAAGEVRFFVHFSDYVKDFINGCIYARKEFLKSNPDAARHFLAGWFEAVDYMRSHKDETVKIVEPVMHVTPAIASRSFDELMAPFSSTGRFPESALNNLAEMWKAMGTFQEPPKMSDLYTEAYLPGSQAAK